MDLYCHKHSDKMNMNGNKVSANIVHLVFTGYRMANDYNTFSPVF